MFDTTIYMIMRCICHVPSVVILKLYHNYSQSREIVKIHNKEITMNQSNCIVSQSGGPTVAINASLAGVIAGVKSSEKYDMVVVAAPAFDFSEDIISKLSDFLYNGGNYEKNMIYIQNFYATDLPNIAEFLADWKIQIGTDVILDDDMTQVRISALGSVDYAPMLSVSDTEAVGTLPNDTLPIVAPGTRVINVVSKNNESVINEVIKSKSTSYTASLVDQSADKGPNGEYNAIVKSRKESASGISVHGSNLLVIGSPFMLDSAMLSNSNTYNNAAVIINTVNNMTGKDSGVIIPEKAIQQNNISLTTGKAKVIEIIVILVIPIAIAVAGAVVLLRRKNR